MTNKKYEDQWPKSTEGVIRDLNAITLSSLREIADGPDGDHQLQQQFGITKRTAAAIRLLKLEDIWRIATLLGSTYLFAAKNADFSLFQMIREGLADPDIFVLAKLRSTAAAKIGGGL